MSNEMRYGFMTIAEATNKVINLKAKVSKLNAENNKMRKALRDIIAHIDMTENKTRFSVVEFIAKEGLE